MTAAGPALADTGNADIEELDLAVIEVSSDGETYTTVSDSSPAITGMWFIHLNAHKRGRVKSWAAWPAMQAQGMPTKDFPELGKSASYPLGDRPKIVNREYPLFIPLQAYRAYVKEACNQMAFRLRNYSGKTNDEIFAVDRSIPVEVSAGITWDMSGRANENPPAVEVTPGAENNKIKPVTIVCLKTPTQPAPELKVVASQLSVEAGNISSGLQSQCVLRLGGAITVTRSDLPVTFRYVDETGKESDVKTISPVPGVVKAMQHVFMHSYPLDHVVGEKNEGKIRMVGENIEFESNWADYDVDCAAPTNDLLVALPPKATRLEAFSGAKKTVHVQTLTVVGVESTSHPYLCPARMRVEGGLQGRGKASGKAVLFASKEQLAEEVYDVDQGDTVYFGGERELSWHVGNVHGQEVVLQLMIRNMAGEVVDSIKSSQTFKCERIVQGALALTPPQPTNDKASAGSGSTPPQSTNDNATAQAGLNFNIVTPKNRVRNGQIRLSGAKPDQAFKLRFLRKSNSGGYKIVNSAQLPKQMTGNAASFNMAALNAGTWRLRVCPMAKGGKIPNVKACKTSDFKVLAAGTFQAPTGDPQQSPTYSIIPNIGG
ncbi:hypothetical protein HBA54_13410 [Pelagibius litoralis]|uniref:Uncharacterized protein n=1 Tax=Pelagibius litoralis TaxID=374515 RepID=A0A967EY62_9PROT|nr:hypothetical protein [Pelagibius litoralis]NIA69593.1 hypothetical protein [Pelagibius litoralis]